MRRLACMVLVLMALSFALLPFNTVHAHIAGDHGGSVMHGGHVHDLHHHQVPLDVSATDHVVVMQVTAADHGSFSLSAPWMPVLWILVAMAFGIAALREVFRPPARSAGPLNKRSWRLPPLRGPPLLSI
ncbi:MAG: hypothetical protein H7Y89_07915 [Steroidobacteraceae bacterium]|nr:hypothetical protein [Steroidobacteraceae bacterium]